MKLEPKHLLPYLIYELPIHCCLDGSLGYLFSLSNHGYNVKGSFSLNNGADKNEFIFVDFRNYINLSSPKNFKPVLRPLSDLTPEELDLFTVNFRMYRNNPNFNYELMIVKDYELALSLHLDIFNLIPNNLAVDINTLK